MDALQKGPPLAVQPVLSARHRLGERGTHRCAAVTPPSTAWGGVTDGAAGARWLRSRLGC